MPQTADMTTTQKLFYLLISCSTLLWSASVSAQVPGSVGGAYFGQHHQKHDHGNDLAFVKNQGQWHPNVLYKAPLGGLNTLFLEEGGFTYVDSKGE